MSFENNYMKRLARALQSHTHKIISKKIFPPNSIIKKNNRGFSLVELMVVVGMLGGLSLIVMNITKQSTKSSSKYQFDSEVMLITNEINAILSDPNKCLTTFTNATQAASPSTPVLNANPANVTNPNGIAGIPSTARKYTLAGGPYGNGGVMIASYSLDLAVTPDPLLTINFQKNGTLGTGTIPKTIKLYVEQNDAAHPGVITQCRSISTASVDIWSHGTGTDINYAGKVGIGTTTPQATLDVSGEVKFGNTSSTCNSANEGQQRYNSISKIMEYCNGTTWGGFGGASSIIMSSGLATESAGISSKSFVLPTGTWQVNIISGVEMPSFSAISLTIDGTLVYTSPGPNTDPPGTNWVQIIGSKNNVAGNRTITVSFDKVSPWGAPSNIVMVALKQ